MPDNSNGKAFSSAYSMPGIILVALSLLVLQSSRLGYVTCRTQCKMKMQGPLLKLQDKSFSLSSTVFLPQQLMRYLQGEGRSPQVLGPSPVPDTQHMHHWLTGLPWPPCPDPTGGKARQRRQEKGQPRTPPGKWGSSSRRDHTWAKAASPQCKWHCPIWLHYKREIQSKNCYRCQDGEHRALSNKRRARCWVPDLVRYHWLNAHDVAPPTGKRNTICIWQRRKLTHRKYY